MASRIDRGGWSLDVERSGADGDVILLSNSLGADRTMWGPQREMLDARFTVLSYDTRGHGGSDTPAGDYSFDDLVSDAVAVLDHFGAEKAAFMGLSLGGMTGLGLALAYPDRVTRLVCADARADAPEPFAKSWDDRVTAARKGGIEALWEGTADRWFTPEWRSANPERLAEVKAMFVRTTVDGYAGCAAALKRLDYLNSLGRLSLPVLYVCGDVDTGAPPDAMRTMAAATPGAEFALVENAAHIANIDSPEQFNATVSRFLGSA
ncbi:3-oxoadipate enol-lactonase [Aquamicrobium sp. LC103]|uniref:3-oxoadipate enol-lactonase n=1 Tax=Aquamicrobium sp. LC103 TaxID=1120658 RepID=UPI00063EAD39|nr:3-oxoadipate enol-lactonase [Aquamicrobium sp. LC103]TKT69231.1 3-oxoadipate enol-lactonase [Aquamicrobium sp. LC103]